MEQWGIHASGLTHLPYEFLDATSHILGAVVKLLDYSPRGLKESHAAGIGRVEVMPLGFARRDNRRGRLWADLLAEHS